MITKEIRWKRDYFTQRQVDLVYDYKFRTGGDDSSDRYLYIAKVLDDINEENSHCTITFFREKEVSSIFNKVRDVVPEIKNHVEDSQETTT